MIDDPKDEGQSQDQEKEDSGDEKSGDSQE